MIIGSIVGAVAGVGTKLMTDTVVKAAMPVAVDKLTEVGVKIGAMAVGVLASKGVEKLVDEDIAKFMAKVEEKKAELEEKKLAKA